ncbi:5-methyltetrahydropteroyltriglutamate--homocysteine methyltransferase [Halobellus salinisoli]|uniref:5-methyltetrahydropteroyltriglutamate-- homocysteine methyltransferase n=1 Tax=Halobellus salinisoli TaxID=3108500 RepID=UPI003008BA8A
MSHLAATVGLYPLPDWAKDDLSELKGHQKEDLLSGTEGAAVAKTYDRARAEVIERQVDAGLDRIVEGQLRWDDMLGHPFAVHDAVETGGIVRYYDNNNFHRELAVTGELTFDGTLAEELDAVTSRADGTPIQAVLPGPYSLIDLAVDEYYGDDREFLAGTAEFLAAEGGAFPEVETVFVLEPSLAVNPPTGEESTVDVDDVIDALSKVAEAFEAEVVVHTYWDALSEDVYTAALDAAVDGLGFDLVNAEPEVQSIISEHGTPDTVALGVADGQNTRVESLREIDDRVSRFEEVASPETIYLTPNTELFYLPVTSAEAKLDVLGRAASVSEVTV